MSVVPAKNVVPKNSRKKIPDNDRKLVSERLIERDFFPQLAHTTASIELEVGDRKRHKRTEVVDLTEESLDTFNDKYQSLENSKIHDSLAKASRESHNPFMFNHPGAADVLPRSRSRKGIIYENTRLPADWEQQHVINARNEALEQAKRLVGATANLSSRPNRNVLPAESSEDILSRGLRRGKRPNMDSA